MGGFQFWVFFCEFVESGEWEVKDFYDVIFCGGCMLVEMVRVCLCGDFIEKDYELFWCFQDLLQNEFLVVERLVMKILICNVDVFMFDIEGWIFWGVDVVIENGCIINLGEVFEGF